MKKKRQPTGAIARSGAYTNRWRGGLQYCVTVCDRESGGKAVHGVETTASSPVALTIDYDQRQNQIINGRTGRGQALARTRFKHGSARTSGGHRRTVRVRRQSGRRCVADSPGEWCARMARVSGKRTRRDAADDEDDIGGDVARRCENDRRPSRVVSTTCLSPSTVLTSAKRYASYQVTFARGVIIRWVYKKIAIFCQYMAISRKRCKIHNSHYGILIGSRT